MVYTQGGEGCNPPPLWSKSPLILIYGVLSVKVPTHDSDLPWIQLKLLGSFNHPFNAIPPALAWTDLPPPFWTADPPFFDPLSFHLQCYRWKTIFKFFKFKFSLYPEQSVVRRRMTHFYVMSNFHFMRHLIVLFSFFRLYIHLLQWFKKHRQEKN